jgi:hypothetical protein
MDPLHIRDLMQRCYLLYIGALTLYSQYMLSFGYKYKSCKHKIVKSANFPKKSGLICKKNVKMLKYFRGGLGGPPIFLACQSIALW